MSNCIVSCIAASCPCQLARAHAACCLIVATLCPCRVSHHFLTASCTFAPGQSHQALARVVEQAQDGTPEQNAHDVRVGAHAALFNGFVDTVLGKGERAATDGNVSDEARGHPRVLPRCNVRDGLNFVHPSSHPPQPSAHPIRNRDPLVTTVSDTARPCHHHTPSPRPTCISRSAPDDYHSTTTSHCSFA